MEAKPGRRLTLDHLTAIEAPPERLIEVAARAGFDAVAMFLNPIRVVPRLPAFDLYGDPGALKALGQRMRDAGVELDCSYPVGLQPGTDPRIFDRLLGATAALGGRMVNVLLFGDRAAQREALHAFADHARGFGVATALEVYPLSGLATLAEGVALVEAIGRPGEVGLTIDSLHMARSGATLAELKRVDPKWILFGQISDGPRVRPRAEWAAESVGDRLLPGAGELDLRGFVAALPADCPLGVEVPRDAAADAGVSVDARAAEAFAATRRVLG